MSTPDPVKLGPYDEAPYGCPTCRTIVRADRVPGGCTDLWHSDNRPPRDWDEHTPGKGWERLRAEMPGLAPELTDEDFAKADAIIAAARKGTINSELTVPEYECPAGHECPGFSQPDLDAAYARGISEGRRQAVEIIEAESYTDGELYRRLVLGEDGTNAR